MEINDILNILNLTQAEINALGAVDSGAIVYNSTTNALETYNGTAWVASGGSDIFVTGGTVSATTLTLDRNDGNDVTISGFTSGGKSYFSTEQRVYPHQILGGINSASSGLGVGYNATYASPISFAGDVEIKTVSVIVSGTLHNNDGHTGVYKLIAKSVQSGVVYYQFDLVRTVSTLFDLSVAGEQEITLSTPYTMTAGDVYVVVLFGDNGAAFTNSTVTGRYNWTNNTFLGEDNKCLRVSAYQAYNPIPTTFTALPSSLYMYPETNSFYSRELLRINIQNA